MAMAGQDGEFPGASKRESRRVGSPLTRPFYFLP